MSNHQGYSTDFAREKLYGWCFIAPWRHDEEIGWIDLSFLGYPFYAATDDGHIFGYHKMRYLHEKLSDDGYPEVAVYDFCLKPHYPHTHQLIAKAFLDNPENKDTVNHKNGIKTDNRVSNLEWMWNYENMDHALKTGLKHSAMSDEKVMKTCELLSQGMPIKEICTIVGCNDSNVRDILDGCHYRISMYYPNIPYLKNARHIPKEFLVNN